VVKKPLPVKKNLLDSDDSDASIEIKKPAVTKTAAKKSAWDDSDDSDEV